MMTDVLYDIVTAASNQTSKEIFRKLKVISSTTVIRNDETFPRKVAIN
jgi:hypothetical protein